MRAFSLIDENVERGTYSILEAPNNGVWIAGPVSLLNWKNGIFNPVITRKDKLNLKSLAINKENEIFFSGERGIFQLKNDKPVPVQGLENIEAPNIFFDRENNSYLIVSQGWEKTGKRHHDCLIDIEIKNGKLWIQCDGTPYGIANELEQEGIKKSEIVLAFHEPEVRKFTEYAIA